MKTIHVAAAVIKDHAGRYFVTQRGYGEYKDFWEFPGGKLEPGETGEEAIVREIREELAISIQVERSIATIEYDYPAFHLSMACFLCSIAAGSPTLLEHEAARWVAPRDLSAVGFLPADRELVEKYLLHV